MYSKQQFLNIIHVINVITLKKKIYEHLLQLYDNLQNDGLQTNYGPNTPVNIMSCCLIDWLTFTLT